SRRAGGTAVALLPGAAAGCAGRRDRRSRGGVQAAMTFLPIVTVASMVLAAEIHAAPEPRRVLWDPPLRRAEPAAPAARPLFVAPAARPASRPFAIVA